MKLSEAIRLGAMLHPQAFGAMQFLNANHEIIGTCAMGAAMRAGYRPDVGAIRIVSCPVHRHASCLIDSNLYAMVTHLNDWHRWTREAIAGWVETIEAAEERKHDDDERRRVGAHATDSQTQVPRTPQRSRCD